jgi:hypothetical protein
VKYTPYFAFVRMRSDRRWIREEWIEHVIRNPRRIVHQPDGRIRCSAPIREPEDRMLRVVLLADGQTVHNALFGRRAKS